MRAEFSLGIFIRASIVAFVFAGCGGSTGGAAAIDAPSTNPAERDAAGELPSTARDGAATTTTADAPPAADARVSSPDGPAVDRVAPSPHDAAPMAADALFLGPGCGAPGQRCCTSGPACDSTAVCHLGSCRACGGVGQRCCAYDTCAAGGTCERDVCLACGGPGQPCCNKQLCAGGGCCASGTCVAPDMPCFSGASCKQGACTNDASGMACGVKDSTCCRPPVGPAYCAGGSACRGAVCEACGGMGEPCCAVDQMANGCLTAGTSCSASGRCEPCGKPGQPCCKDGRCDPFATCAQSAMPRVCRACGYENGPCCPNGTCAEPYLGCSGNPLSPTTSSCTRDCGKRGQTCCTHERCEAGLMCVLDRNGLRVCA